MSVLVEFFATAGVIGVFLFIVVPLFQTIAQKLGILKENKD